MAARQTGSEELLLKLSFDKDLRRVRVTLPLTFAALHAVFASTFGAIASERGTYACSYVDDEDDTVNVCNDLDLEEAFRVCGAVGDGGKARASSMRLRVVVRPAPPSRRHRRDGSAKRSSRQRSRRSRRRGGSTEDGGAAPAPRARRARSADGLGGSRQHALNGPVDFDSLSSVFSSSSILGSVDASVSSSGAGLVDQPWRVPVSVGVGALNEWGLPERVGPPDAAAAGGIGGWLDGAPLLPTYSSNLSLRGMYEHHDREGSGQGQYSGSVSSSASASTGVSFSEGSSIAGSALSSHEPYAPPRGGVVVPSLDAVPAWSAPALLLLQSRETQSPSPPPLAGSAHVPQDPGAAPTAPGGAAHGASSVAAADVPRTLRCRLVKVRFILIYHRY